MTAVAVGMLEWEASRDKDGHRDYKSSYLVKTDDLHDGPRMAMLAEGLPAIGSTWDYDNDRDDWALCTPESTVKPVYTKERCHYFIVDLIHTTRPLRRCQDSQIDNPLFEPYRIGGSFTTYSEEAYYDRFGRPIMSSSYEMYQGAEIEFDAGRPTISIGFNSPDVPVPIFAPIIHVLNDNYLWGLAPRTIKLSGVRWQRLMYGTCSFYYSIDYDFEINYNTWDRLIPDMGTRHLKTGGDPDNITHFKTYVDPNTMEPTKCFLNGSGEAAEELADVFVKRVEKYAQGNLLLLGVPSDLTM